MEKKFLIILTTLLIITASIPFSFFLLNKLSQNDSVNDTDGDGYLDIEDEFPYNPLEQKDTDDDGIGDNSDRFQDDPAASVDSDNDGYPDYWNPGKNQSDSISIPPLELDEFPNDPRYHRDGDNDGIPSELDINDRVNLTIIFTIKHFELLQRVDLFRRAQVYFDLTMGENMYRIYNNGDPWIVKIKQKKEIEYEISYDIPDNTAQRYMNIILTTYDKDIFFGDDLIDISNEDNQQSLFLIFDKSENTISDESGFTEGKQGKVWFEVTLAEEKQNQEAVYERTYHWLFGGMQWKFSVNIPVQHYQSYLGSTIDRMPQKINVKGLARKTMVSFVTSDDVIVVNIAQKLNQLADKENYSLMERLNFILRFVQKNILYVSDNETKGMLEYWRYPVETLVEKKGDCEDTAILFASILDALGYEVVLLFYILDNETGHLSVGIHLEDGYGEFIEDNSGKRYYYCETTNSMYQIGEIPSNIGNQPDDIIAI